MKNIFRLFIGLMIASSLTSCSYNGMVEKREAVKKNGLPRLPFVIKLARGGRTLRQIF